MRTKFKNLEGQKFNSITIISKSLDNHEDIKRNKWICRCDCGKEIKIRISQLFDGQKSCGCARTVDLIGHKFGKLIVIKRILDNVKTDSLWLCRCECGKEKTITGSHLRKNLTKSCGCIMRKGYKEIGGTYFNRIRHSARNRNIIFEITIEQIWDLFIKQERKCALSGLELHFSSKCDAGDGTASLDRIDSKKDYTIDNIQWVHKDINYMKQDNTDEEFIKYCKLVANYNN